MTKPFTLPGNHQPSPTLKKMLDNYNDAFAKREGWAVFTRDDGTLQIQRLDFPSDVSPEWPDEPVFDSDAAALAFVRDKAAAGSQMHAAALGLNGSHYTK